MLGQLSFLMNNILKAKSISQAVRHISRICGENLNHCGLGFASFFILRIASVFYVILEKIKLKFAKRRIWL